MPNDYCDSSLLDKAILFATKAHKNVERKGKGVPYICHPLEAMSIVATASDDQELLAAACLHDVIEDTDYTYEDIKKQFGKRVADLVQAESDTYIPGMDAAESWKIRKEIAMKHLSEASREVQLVAIGDKLSNMRAMYRDYKEVGDKLWEKFHVKDPVLHEWHYRELLASFNKIRDTEPYKEFEHLVNKTFDENYALFSLKKVDNFIIASGSLNDKNIQEMIPLLDPCKETVIDFKDVHNINFSGLRALFSLKNRGYQFAIKNVSLKVAHRFDATGLSNELNIIRAPREFDKNNMEESGDGYTAVTYFTNDGDAMIKLYYEFVDKYVPIKEKRFATGAALLGIPTPLAGDLVEVDGKLGIMFERIKGKKSFARLLSEDYSKLDELAKRFALLSKKLHSTQSNKDIFPNAKEAYKKYANNFKDISEEERNKIINFIDNIEDKDTCLHGDFHFGNAIITENDDELFIDMGDFSYGNPLLDLGTLYFVTHNDRDDHSERLFHNSNAVLKEFYEHFVKYYFEGKELEEVDELLKPYSALTVIHFASMATQKPWMAFYVREYLLSVIKWEDILDGITHI